MKLLVIHGPNLKTLGKRKPEVYGALTLSEINNQIKKEAEKHNSEVKIFQSNFEGGIIDFIEDNSSWAEAIIINPAAYTHYSYAIRDAIEACGLPAAEVHLSDVESREDFRKISVIMPVCEIRFKGEGINSYLKAVKYFCEKK